MRFDRFGVTLERLEPRHLEIVRQWRNGDWVRPHMRYRSVVQPADQDRWFEGLDPRRDWYFCAHLRESPFALFHVKAIDWEAGCGESGGFVGHPRLIGRPEPAQATLALMDFAFLLLGLESLEAQYRSALQHVVRFNAQLGYEVFREEADGFVRARVSRARYFACAEPFRAAAVAMHGTEATLTAPDPWLAERVARCDGQAPADFCFRLR